MTRPGIAFLAEEVALRGRGEPEAMVETDNTMSAWEAAAEQTAEQTGSSQPVVVV